jgi:hypothetical protein
MITLLPHPRGRGKEKMMAVLEERLMSLRREQDV